MKTMKGGKRADQVILLEIFRLGYKSHRQRLDLNKKTILKPYIYPSYLQVHVLQCGAL